MKIHPQLWYDENLADLANTLDIQLAKGYNKMSEGSDLMSTKNAAKYLGMPVATLKWHVVKGHVTPQKIGRSLVFTKVQLEAFKAHPLFRVRIRKVKDTD